MLKDIERNNFSLTKHPNVEQEIEEVFQSFEHLHSSLEIRRRREVLQRLASLGQLAAGVAHEIRNPLGSIKGLMNLIAESLPDGDPRNEYAEVILREVGRMEGIINRFLSVSPSKYMEINQEEINLDLILDEAISLAKLSCSQTNEIEIIKEGNLDVNIIGDREKLGQALFNVILNAHQAMPKEGGTLRVSIKRLEDNSIQVKFSDTGMGIAEENIERIFDPFYTSKEEGVGLGLTITHQIITAHKGDIRVESIKGKGSDFIISLPVGG
ncbi:MAG: hypothetical protein KKC66_04215 [Candidatus Omnitrophica bacterium]|nr:hypothetical protein [Candidatus Omnitrophota bacterium]MBU1933085.1 hypothetical protein [Candidatus Omnitrophota bacterium]